jgi:hypothetical protein
MTVQVFIVAAQVCHYLRQPIHAICHCMCYIAYISADATAEYVISSLSSKSSHCTRKDSWMAGIMNSERMWAWMPDIDCQSNISGRGSLDIILVEIIQENTAGFLSPKCCRYSHTYPLFLHKPMLEARKDWPMIDLADTLSVEHTSSG